MILVEYAVTGVGYGVLAGEQYADAVRSGRIHDCLHIREYVSPMVDAMIDRGLLAVHHRPGGPVISLANPFASKRQQSFDLSQAFTGQGRKLYSDEVSQAGTQCVPLVYALTQLDDGITFRIDHEHVPAFLAVNGITAMNSDELAAFVKSNFPSKMRLKTCTCLGHYSLLKETFSFRVGSSTLPLEPGDVALHVKMDLDFKKDYLSDPEGFEDKLKADIIGSIGFASSPDAPGFSEAMQQHVRIVEVRNGSIEVVIIIGASLLVASAFAAALYLGREFSCYGPGGSGVRVGPEPVTRRVRTVRMVGRPDGSFSIEGTYAADHETRSGCVLS